ncbi:MAG: DUF2807 domain-containing protein [Bacteroidota bacterium]|nr:DUF2807 domain-containing protein [Bacteroidota bacterium]
MKKIGIALLMLLMAFASVSAQKVVYDDHAQKRSVGTFHAIETSSGIEVVISKGDKEELAVSVGNQEYMDQVRTVVENGVLKISRTSDDWKFWNKWKNWHVKVYVSYVTLDALRASSGGSVNGSELNLQALSARLSSGGSITLNGKVDRLDVDGNSGAQFRGYSLITNFCKAEASSGAGVQITVNKEISAKANSGGFVRFKGEGLIRDINVNSGGSVKRQN